MALPVLGSRISFVIDIIVNDNTSHLYEVVKLEGQEPPQDILFKQHLPIDNHIYRKMDVLKDLITST